MNGILILLTTHSLVAVFGNYIPSESLAQKTCREYLKKNQKIWDDLVDIKMRRLNITSRVDQMKFEFLEEHVFPRFKDVLRSLRADPSKNVSSCSYQARTGIDKLSERFEQEYQECLENSQSAIDDLRSATEESIKTCEHTAKDIKQLDHECSLGTPLRECREEDMLRIWHILQSSMGSYVTLNGKVSFVVNDTLNAIKFCVEKKRSKMNSRLSALINETKNCVENSSRITHDLRSNDDLRTATSEAPQGKNIVPSNKEAPNLMNRALNYLREKWQILSLGFGKIFSSKS